MTGSTFFTTRGLAEFLGVATSTIENWRYHGEGPPYIRVGGAIRYAATDVDAWLAAQKCGGASATTP